MVTIELFSCLNFAQAIIYVLQAIWLCPFSRIHCLFCPNHNKQFYLYELTSPIS